MVSYCVENATSPWESSYWKYVISVPIMIILQSILLINSCLHCKELLSIPKRISISVFSVQIIGLLWFISDIFKNISFVQFPQLIIDNKALCYITGYVDKIFPFLFTAALLYQLLIRLQITFKNSSFALKNGQFYCLFSFFIFPFSIFLTLWIIYLDKPCYEKWRPSDYNDTFFICNAKFEHNKVATYTAYIGICWVLISNICFGLLFSWKLNGLIKKISDENKKNNSIQKLMVKNTILTVSISISTFINYLIYFIDDKLDFFLYLDVFLNSLFISLMFKYNDNIYYKFICKLCNDYYQHRHKDLELVSYLSDERSKNDTITSTSENVNRSPSPESPN